MRRRSTLPTMKDIAQRANVSIGTVSRVLNRHEDVDKELRTRVEAVVRKIGYRPSARTRNVVQAKSRVIGLVLCNDFGLHSANSLLLLGVEKYCSEAGFNLLFARHQSPAGVDANSVVIPNIMQTPGLADCVIVSGTVYGNLLEAMDRHGLKYVLLANHLVDGTDDRQQEHCLRYDDFGGSQRATHYLAQLGHEDIWYIGDASRAWNRNRHRGYATAMAELGRPPHAHTIALSDDEFENGQAAISYILDQGWPVTAILAGSEELAFGAREGLRQHRREVPKDISLIGFENEAGRGRGSHLTSVCVDMVEVGRQLAKLAIAQMEVGEAGPREVVVPAVLVKRSTCRPLRKEEQMLL